MWSFWSSSTSSNGKRRVKAPKQKWPEWSEGMSAWNAIGLLLMLVALAGNQVAGAEGERQPIQEQTVEPIEAELLADLELWQDFELLLELGFFRDMRMLDTEGTQGSEGLQKGPGGGLKRQ